METQLNLISQKAKEDKGCKFNNLMHLINVASMRSSYRQLKKGKSPGIDGVTLEEYGIRLNENITEVLERMKRMSYTPQPVRRTYIPKANGGKRPLGIPAIEDKMVQMCFKRILETIYETDFQDNSYGFREGKSCHQALTQIDKSLMFKPVNYIIDADIKGFFDNVNHEWMERFLKERISDVKFIRYIKRFLQSGIMEEGKYQETERGTPQGGIVSPVLANIYLHYVLDRWFRNEIEKKSRGFVELVRYCDDFVIMAEKEEEAMGILTTLRKRLSRFSLELSEEKTRIIRFGRIALSEAEQRGEKPATFNFLGFTHYCCRSRKGKYKVSRRTEKKRFTRSLNKIKEYIRNNRNIVKLKILWESITRKLRGHYNYYGVSENFRSIQEFYHKVEKLLMKWLNRRSQKKSYTWEQFRMYLKRFPLPKPRIYKHFYQISKTGVRGNEELYAGNPHVQFCEGGRCNNARHTHR